ncbi:MAG TPA: ankyrin repeat domain-containing protein [Stellaceae bacterium]|nr:ankyrin repeat domain-containing protein [Stellaceae bacterium]
MVGRKLGDPVGGVLMKRGVIVAAVLLAMCGSTFGQSADLSGLYTVANAASHDKTDDVIRELQNKNDPNTTDDNGETALDYAAQFGDVRMANALIFYGANVNARDSFGNTALHWAAQRGATDVMQLLLDAKTVVDAQNKQGVTPLMMAAKSGQVLAARLLIKNGADPHKQDFTGRDAIGWAEGRPNVLVVLHAAGSG